MKRDVKINIPNPCQEEWNQMTPDEKGRFCSVCAKSVIDFTEKSDEEIKEIITQNLENNICGRFKKSQISHPLSIQIPQQLVYSQTQYHKMFLLALFIIMGTTLFSCTDKKGNIQKIKKIEVINQPKEKIKKIHLGEISHNPNDSLHKNILQPPPLIDRVKFVKAPKKSIHKVVKLQKTNPVNSRNLIEEEDFTIYGTAAPSVKPDYVGGMNKFYSFIKNNYKPKKEGKIKARFVIEKDGSLTDLKIINAEGTETVNDFIETLKLSPKWYPAIELGKPKPYEFELFLNITKDSIRKGFIFKKIIPRIDTICVKEITKLENG